MFRGFNLRVDSSNYKQFFDIGNTMTAPYLVQVREDLNRYVGLDGVIDGEAIEEDWFPKIKADVFISHSRDDSYRATAIAGWLYEALGLTSFIDGCVWGYADHLLKKIDDRYCPNGQGNYNYQKRNRSTSHIHLMLSTALSKMIDQTECLFFLNTPNSVSSKGAVLEKTYSPWIYSEIAISAIVRKQIPERLIRVPSVKMFSKGGEMVRLDESFRMEFSLKTGHLTALTEKDMDEWFSKCQKLGNLSKDARDLLYELFPIDLLKYK